MYTKIRHTYSLAAENVEMAKVARKRIEHCRGVEDGIGITSRDASPSLKKY